MDCFPKTANFFQSLTAAFFVGNSEYPRIKIINCVELIGESVKCCRNILRFPLLCGMEPFSFFASCCCEYLVICYLKSLPSPLNILQGKIRCIAHLLAKLLSFEMKQLLECALWLNGCHNVRSDDNMLLAKGHDLLTRRNHHRPIPGAHRRSAVTRQLLNLKIMMILKQTQS